MAPQFPLFFVAAVFSLFRVSIGASSPARFLDGYLSDSVRAAARSSRAAAGFVEGSLRGCACTSSVPRRRALSSVNLLANMRDGLLIDRSSIPCLDSSEIRFAGLVSRARAPAMTLEEICRRGQCVGRGVEISAGTVV